MFKRKWFILVLLIVLVGIFFQYYQYSQDNLHKRIAESENTMMRTDAIRFSFKVVVMLQKGYISLTQSIADKDEDKFYDALDYIEAGQGFLHMEYIQNDKLVAKLNPLIEDIYNKIESFGLNITQKELDNIHTNLIFIEKEMELSEKDIWIEFQKNYINFQTNEYKLDNIYSYIILFISFLLLVFTLILIRQRKLNSIILEHEKELKNLAYYDTLTQIPNRKSIENVISENISSSKRNNKEFYIALVDLDNFKMVNDVHGHNSGDILLIECVKRIKSCIRDVDVLGRFGGDEFIIVFDNLSHYSKLITIFNRIGESFKKPIRIGKIQHSTNVSIGISSYPNDAKSVSDLIKNADIAMYHSKVQGKAQYSFFENKLAIKMQRQYEIEPQIKEALEFNQFELYYQPQIDVKTNSVISVEALVRWNHPEKGFVSPFYFIDIIENGYMTKEFGEWVIIKASKEQKNWLKKGIDISVSVNLSVKHIMMSSFYDDMIKLISRLNIDLKRFSFEITEYELLTYKDRSVKVLNDLVEKGFNFHLDDFGTGYSSITYLNEVNIESIKIDKSFIDKIVIDTDEAHFVDTIINMAKALEIKIIAEGVESEIQQKYLQKLECDIIQGYYYSKPLSVCEFEKYIKEYKV